MQDWYDEQLSNFGAEYAEQVKEQLNRYPVDEHLVEGKDSWAPAQALHILVYQLPIPQPIQKLMERQDGIGANCRLAWYISMGEIYNAIVQHIPDDEYMLCYDDYWDDRGIESIDDDMLRGTVLPRRTRFRVWLFKCVVNTWYYTGLRKHSGGKADKVYDWLYGILAAATEDQ